MATSPKSSRKARVRAEGVRLMTAVERLVDDPDTLIAQVEAFKMAVNLPADDAEYLEVLCAKVIDHYSIKTAIIGGATALPAVVPGPGSLVAVVGGSLVDMTLVLKHEVEMAMCLTHLHGFDLRDERERWLAYVLAGVRTYEVQAGRNYFVDLLEAQLDVLPKYTPREIFKIASAVLGRLALRSMSRGMARALPLVGIVVGAATNKLMTASVGWACVDTLERRRRMAPPEPVVDAVVSPT